MKIFVHGFWDGFINKTNPINISFFINIFSKVFQENIEIGDLDESELLLESIFHDKTYLYYKKWNSSFLFSGESRLNAWAKDYNCVLYGEKNHSNIVNIPLFILMNFCSDHLPSLSNNLGKIIEVPKKNILAIISNSNGKERNFFLEQLEKVIPIDYAGSYKTNVPKIEEMYNTPEFIEKVSQYKFIVTMENSRGQTYITEKILHGFHAGTIPIYWGSLNVDDYFNKERFLQIKDMNNQEEVNKVIEEIVFLSNNEEKYLENVNKPILIHSLEQSLEKIVKDIQNLLFKKPIFIDKIYSICNNDFEPLRFQRLNNMFSKINIEKRLVEYICPTYKQTITKELINKHVKDNLIKKLRVQGMKRAEISLFLNYKAVLENISKNYSDGIFLILESDVVIINENLDELNEFLLAMNDIKEGWDLIHIGKDLEESNYFCKSFFEGTLPYREKTNLNEILPNTFIEDITSPTDKFRLIRKIHTRCTDSFLWNYSAVIKFLDYINNNSIYDAPFDYYMTNFFENNLNFKHYWSMNTFFIQGSNYGMEESTIQKDWY
jgi:hypothetical protein